MTPDFVFKTMTGHDLDYWIDQSEVLVYQHYADRRKDAGKGILSANWNHFPRHNPLDQEFNWSRKGRRFGDILEQLGWELEWQDTTSRCDHCQGLILDDPDYYGDSQHYADLGDDRLCEDCVRRHYVPEYLESLEDNPHKALYISGINLEQHGYAKLNPVSYEAGFHPGQNDDPRKIYEAFRDQGYEHLVFAIDDSGQFDTRFSLWARKSTD